MLYHDFDRKQSHSIFGLVRRMKEMTVGQLWRLLQVVSLLSTCESARICQGMTYATLHICLVLTDECFLRTLPLHLLRNVQY